MTDPALNCLKPHLSNITAHTLWFADENALGLCEAITENPLLTVITNRYDIYQILNKKNITAVFSDFNKNDYQLKNSPQKILYRISKEKPLVHFLINQAKELLNSDGTFITSGLKNEGIKTYGDKISKALKATGKLKKHGNAYCGEYKFSNETSEILDDQNYAEIQKLETQENTFYSKPGVFGWDKIDQGTSLLLQSFETLQSEKENANKTLLDLGCGYGLIGLSIDKYGFESITATDNNAAALLCAKKNASLMQTPVQVIASNCADTISDTFDIVLCNPPFHRGFQHHQDLTALFLQQASKRLKPKSIALFVVNSFIDIENTAKEFFTTIEVKDKNKSFKVLLLNK